MRKQTLLLSAAALVAGFVFVASPASAIDTCATICHCEIDCSTSCFYGQFFPEPIGLQVYAENCGEYGKCAGAASCPGDCPAQSCTTTWNGTSGNDTFNGGSARECAYGKAGNDTLDGNAGDDRLYGEDGTDTLYGDSGNDCLWGGNHNDYLDGESGYDQADGGGGSGDTCYAEEKANCP